MKNIVKLTKEPWIILRYDKVDKLYNLIHNASLDISELTDGQVKLGKLKGTAAGLNTADLPSLHVIRKGFFIGNGKWD